MANLNSVILPAKAMKDGRHKVRISLAHNGETKYIITDIVLTSTKEFSDGKIVKRTDANYLNVKLRKILTDYQRTLDSTEYISGMTCGELLSVLKNKGTECKTLKQIFDAYISTARIKDSSHNVYESQLHVLESLLSKDYIVEKLSYQEICSLTKKLNKKGYSSTASRNILMFLRILYRYGVKHSLISLRKDPWLDFKMPLMEIRESWVSPDAIKKIRDAIFKTAAKRRHRDFFMLSFYLGGINLADLFTLDFKKVLKENKVRYKRKKASGPTRITHLIEFTLPPEAREIMERLVKEAQPMLTNGAEKRHVAVNIAHYAKKIGEELGIPGLIFYSARKTFAQIAFRLQIQPYVIDYILGHSKRSSNSCLNHYVYVTPDMANDAIRKVLDFIK